MSREIKFRAWFYNEMYSWESLVLDKYTFDDFDRANYVFMQFIGLQDKNGKDIYEGDIIKTINGNWGIVVKKNHGFQVTVSETDSSFYTVVFMCESEIIGNIHENPELLS